MSQARVRVATYVACIGFVICVLAGNSGAQESPLASANLVLRLAVTTSTQDSGLLEEILPPFEQESGLRVDVVAVGTGAALRLGERGDVDALLCHAPEQEKRFMDAGHGVRREAVMRNRFVVLGPKSDPARAGEAKSAADALARIALTQARFMSRGDQSGTHRSELRLWKDIGERPDWPNYYETGQGMGRTLIISDEKQAYTLCDEATFLKFQAKLSLAVVFDEGAALDNPYAAITVAPSKNARINVTAANRFVDYLICHETQKRIAGFRIQGKPLFEPLRLEKGVVRETHTRKQDVKPKIERNGLIVDSIGEALRLIVGMDALVVDAAIRSLFVSSVAVLGALVIGIPLALVLAELRFPGRMALVFLARAAMSVPTVFLGVVCYAMFSRLGPLGALEILYTPWAIIAGEFLLAFPLITSLAHGAFANLDPRVAETAATLGASRIQRAFTSISEARIGVLLAVLVAFSRCVTELGIAMLVGGNLKGQTRTLPTATALETNQGDFSRALAMGLLLFLLAGGVTFFVILLGREEQSKA